MAILLTLALFVGAALVTGVALRLQGRRRGKELQGVVRSQGAVWGSLCRVVAGGTFLDQRRPRRGKGPRGTLLADDVALYWRPDRYEARHGDQPYTWAWADVACTGSRAYRDITGLRGLRLHLAVPQGSVTIVAFHPTGRDPASWQPSKR